MREDSGTLSFNRFTLKIFFLSLAKTVKPEIHILLKSAYLKTIQNNRHKEKKLLFFSMNMYLKAVYGMRRNQPEGLGNVQVLFPER